MTNAVVMQYVGFQARGAVREYTFTVLGTGGASSEYLVIIANDAFVAHRVRYQDGPDVCSLRLQRELATRTDHPPSTRFCITDAELADYKAAHTPKANTSASARRKDNDY